MTLEGYDLAKEISQLVLEKKGLDVLILDLEGMTSIADYFIVCTAESDIQVKAIYDHIVEKLSEQQLKPWHVEGFDALNWVLIDLVDVIVHIFQPSIREYYNLERLWGDAKFIRIED